MVPLLLALALLLAVPAAAQAAELEVVDGQLRYTGAPGMVSSVTFEETGPGVVEVVQLPSDMDPITIGEGCTGTGPFICTGVEEALLDAGDRSDRLQATFGDAPVRGLKTIPATLLGREGNDALIGGLGPDTLDGGPGDDTLDGSAGDDSLQGGDGNDVLQPNTGTDGVSGGDGIDRVLYGERANPSYTLDGRANDGDPGENDLIGADVEEIVSSPPTGSTMTAVLVGDGYANRLIVTAGRGLITGGDGWDIIEGGPLDDVIDARDGSPDTVICNGGNDTVVADTLDRISPSCENVTVLPFPGGVWDDRPPLLQWVFPAPDASLTANSPTTLSVNASDDRGLARVQFYDDDRLLCDDSVPPYTCDYQPRGGDVGPNTLLAIATDSANQTTTRTRVVTVRRFSPGELTLRLRPGRDRTAPYAFQATGALTRPETVSPSQGCSGTVTISARRGRKVVSTKRVRLTRTCEYEATLRFRKRVAKRLRLTARFGGNDVLGTRTSRARSVRLG
jgi:Ca2+-binding RTX toxin-like protein